MSVDTALVTGQGCDVAAAQFGREGNISDVARIIQRTLREPGALLDLSDPVALQPA